LKRPKSPQTSANIAGSEKRDLVSLSVAAKKQVRRNVGQRTPVPSSTTFVTTMSWSVRANYQRADGNHILAVAGEIENSLYRPGHYQSETVVASGET
jgi:hypothetical protein